MVSINTAWYLCKQKRLNAELLKTKFFIGGSCDWTTTSHAKMNLAMEIHHTDFSYHCKDFEGKEWHVFEFYAGASSSQAIVASMGTGTCPCLVGTTIIFYIPISRDWNNAVLRVITINSF